MSPLIVLVVSVGLASATRATHAVSFGQCVHSCETKNECRTSLDNLSCESSCAAVCKCAAISRRMLNKPKHCAASMLEQHNKKLALFRMGHPIMKKVVLKDDEPKFEASVSLDDFWPHGHDAKQYDSEEDSMPRKPVMLNSRSQLSLLKKDAFPWSAERRSKGGHRHHHHRHHHSAALLDHKKNITKMEQNSTTVKKNSTKAEKNSTKAPVAPAALNATSVKKVSTNKTNASKVATSQEAKATTASTSSKASPTMPSKVTPTAKNVTSRNATEAAKVVAPSHLSKTAAAEKTKESGKKK